MHISFQHIFEVFHRKDRAKFLSLGHSEVIVSQSISYKLNDISVLEKLPNLNRVIIDIDIETSNQSTYVRLAIYLKYFSISCTF